jgi:sugar phosphate isomerase/epimerase
MRLGVFTPLLSHLPLEDVLAKLKSLQIDAVELGTIQVMLTASKYK